MNMSFAQQIASAVENVFKSPETASGREYLKILDELVEGIRALKVGARVAPTKDPRKYILNLHPPYRPGMESPMASFFLDAKGCMDVDVSGHIQRSDGCTSPLFDTSITCDNPEKLRECILYLVQLKGFVDAVKDLRDKATEPVEARLNVFAKMHYSQGDVVVEVSAKDQARLGKASPGERLVLDVARCDFQNNAHFGKTQKWEMLNSAGLSLRVESVKRLSPPKAKVTGIVQQVPPPLP
jgi:hypothetical protein